MLAPVMGFWTLALVAFLSFFSRVPTLAFLLLAMALNWLVKAASCAVRDGRAWGEKKFEVGGTISASVAGRARPRPRLAARGPLPQRVVSYTTSVEQTSLDRYDRTRCPHKPPAILPRRTQRRAFPSDHAAVCCAVPAVIRGGCRCDRAGAHPSRLMAASRPPPATARRDWPAGLCHPNLLRC